MTDEGRCDIYMNVNIGGPRPQALVSAVHIYPLYYGAAAAAAGWLRLAGQN